VLPRARLFCVSSAVVRSTDDRQGQAQGATEQYRQTIPEAGVYLIRNAGNGKALLGSTANLGSLRNKLEFAKTTNMPSTLDGRMARDIAQFGIDGLSLEVLEIVDVHA